MPRVRSARLVAVVALAVAGCGRASEGDPWLRVEVEKLQRQIEADGKARAKAYVEVHRRLDDLEESVRRAAKPAQAERARPREVAPVKESAVAVIEQKPKPPRVDEEVELIEVSFRRAETNSSWTKFAWRASIRNTTGEPKKFDLALSFKDRNGFAAEQSTEYGLRIGPHTVEEFTGNELIGAEVAEDVFEIAGKVTE